jgi:tRNA-specific 2-thiouridylase
MPDRVLVAMSGGVDSSVAAARLISEGFDVVGVTLHLWDYPDDGTVKGRCCAPEDVHDARRVADALGFPHFAFDRRELFLQTVVDPFVDAYLSGQTPSPCVRCNRGVKLKELLHLADRLQAKWVATGHYARLCEGAEGPELLKAQDRDKDQSYFLHMLPASVLGRLIFPLGGLSKIEVRQQAVRMQLPGAHKGESQELCFVPTGRYASFVAERAKDRLRPGPILDEQGQQVGTHVGVHAFTIGQRRNLGVALGKRSYVTGIDAATGTVRLGAPAATMANGAVLKEVMLHSGVEMPLQCEVVVRYRGRPVAAEVRRHDGAECAVYFREPLSAVVPGQYAVFYAGERVLGGGLIEAPLLEAPLHLGAVQ